MVYRPISNQTHPINRIIVFRAPFFFQRGWGAPFPGRWAAAGAAVWVVW